MLKVSAGVDASDFVPLKWNDWDLNIKKYHILAANKRLFFKPNMH